ncbi:MAG TPA: DJ-1/PfpI family protein [Blastocatellia bacterium]|nr:DJ-1/PfpI family protein [Blastocatellia bacterium]
MKPKAYFLIFDGLADWELAHALCEINKSGKFEVVSVGFSDQSVTTMGGLKLSPDIKLDKLKSVEAGIFMLPGGDMWERESHENLKTLLRRVHADKVPIGAICGATLEIARAGLTRGIRHTSNSKDYLRTMVADYGDENFYVGELAVTDRKIITASGLGCVEFAREVIKQLNIYNEADTQTWFEMFKHGVYPVRDAA